MAKWHVQHEMDDEPTYLTPEDDPDGDYVRLDPKIPWQKRLEVAAAIREILERE